GVQTCALPISKANNINNRVVISIWDILFKTSKIRKFKEDSRKEDFIFPNFRIQMFRMKRILIFGGILLIVISFLGFLRNYKKKEVLLQGEEVNVAIVSYQSYSGKIKGSFKFQYKGKRYSKDLKGEFYQEVKNNRTIQLKTNSDNSIFYILMKI